MTGLLDHLPPPAPDVERFKVVLRRGRPDRVPLVELAIADEVLAALNGCPLAPACASSDRSGLREWAAQRVGLWHRLGYDYYRVRAEIPFAVGRQATADTASATHGLREWANEHQGVIHSRADVETYAWPAPADIDFAPAEAAIHALPAEMGAIGFSGGVLEWASALLGLESLSLMLYDDPELVREVVDRVGAIVYGAFEAFCELDRVFAIWLGDDLGFKTTTLLSPQHLREYILPWHRKYAELAHRTGRSFLLHSCGHVEAVMPDLIDEVRIDAKHSFEDAIAPVEEFKHRWGHRLAVLGGVDVDLLSRGSVDQVRARTREILESCAPDGGYACGSGNSITNYVPPANYLAMLETVHQFNARL